MRMHRLVGAFEWHYGSLATTRAPLLSSRPQHEPRLPRLLAMISRVLQVTCAILALDEKCQQSLAFVARAAVIRSR